MVVVMVVIVARTQAQVSVRRKRLYHGRLSNIPFVIAFDAAIYIISLSSYQDAVMKIDLCDVMEILCVISIICYRDGNTSMIRSQSMSFCGRQRPQRT